MPRPLRDGSSGDFSEGPLPQDGLLEVTENTSTRNNVHNAPTNIAPHANSEPPTNRSLLVALTDSPILIFQKLAGRFIQVPHHSFDPLKLFLTSPFFDDYLLTQYMKLAQQWYFKPANMHNRLLEQPIVSRLSSFTSVSRWVSLISMGMCEAFIRGDTSQNELHNLWMQHIGNSLKRELSYDPTSHEAQNRRRDLIHVSILRTLIIPNSDLYQVLQSVASAFLQLAFSEPALWAGGSNFAYVPLMNVLNLGSHELAYFALVDCSCAMALGLPQLIEYDTTMYAQHKSSPPHQWAHGSPTEFQLILADINACRDNSPTARDWRGIERWLLDWRSLPGEHTFTEPWMAVAWYAVQESWRLALLVYLYLAVCNVSSDDPRIQAYVKQLLQVVGTVKKQGSSSVEVQFLVQYLIAGICARSEAHRKIVRNALDKTKEPKLWIICGSDFIPVLDHLWHGAAVDGRPVQWRDYMRSREAMLPVAAV